jgi:hypothetical protein
MKIALQQVQQNIADIANRHEYTPDIIYELLAAYGRSKSAITQLREGHLNKSEDTSAVLQKDVVYFRTFSDGTPLEDEVEGLYEDPLTQRYKPRYLIATDLTSLAAKDTVKDTTLTIKLADIDDHLDFFYAWTGDEVVDTKTEARADRRAADKMNELYVEIEKTNRQEFISNPNFRHELNIFFTRLLFCYFAEDTGIYEDSQFTNAIKTYTQTDGSDLAWFFDELFSALDTKPEDNGVLKTPFKEFPYVNGSIFNTVKHAIAIPEFSAQARHLILECGRQNWSEINPDIFGTIFQGVVDPEHRDENGMDYTSVPNIMKVIQPLFLDGLDEEFDKYYDNENKLWALLARVQKIKVFDPACGSGNFLIIAYKELRKLQHKIIARIDQLRPAGLLSGLPDNQLINIHNFYGIEIDDFAHELAVLSLFLAKHQMNQEFTQQFGKQLSIIPLIDIPTIKHGNAARMDWQEVCANGPHILNPSKQLQMGLEIDDQEPAEQQEIFAKYVYDEIYLVGNPPYKGFSQQTPDQKQDLQLILGSSTKLDYISCWFIKASNYIKGSAAKCAFVSTNSITQGEQVALLWPLILVDNSIEFAYTSFKWQNSARDNAGVTVVIICLTANLPKIRALYVDGLRRTVDFINPYLTDVKVPYVTKRSKALSSPLPPMVLGDMPNDFGGLQFTPDEFRIITEKYPITTRHFKKVLGSAEFIRGVDKWTLWLDDDGYAELNQIPEFQERFELVRAKRAESKKASYNKFANKPHKFIEIRRKETSAILVPGTSSEKREYVPIGFVEKDFVINNLAFAVYDAEPWLFAVLTSKIHNLWIRTVCGSLETRVRYSSVLGYNTFPLQVLNETEKDALNKSARRILLARASHPEKSLADMYDPAKMPTDLREAHEENDHLVDNLYKKGGFAKDEDRLVALFELYEQMILKEKTK